MKLMMIILKQQILAYLWSIIYTQLFITINSFTINTLIVIIYEARCLDVWPQTYYGQIDKRHTSIYTVCQTCPNYSGDSIKRAHCSFSGSCSSTRVRRYSENLSTSVIGLEIFSKHVGHVDATYELAGVQGTFKMNVADRRAFLGKNTDGI